MRRRWWWLALLPLLAILPTTQSSAAVCTTTLSGAQSFASLTVPAGEVYCLDPAVSTTVEMGGNLIVEGTLEAKPASASVVHTIRFTDADEGAYVGGGMDPVATDDGLWVMGAGKLDLQGTPKVAWNRTGDDPSWSASDELVVAPVNAGDYGSGGFQSFTKGSAVPTAGAYSAEVLNLTRNVRIEGMPPQFESPVTGENNDPGRAHILVRSSVPQTIKHVAIRYMGPRQPVDSQKSDDVLGRYGLHFHHSGDGSRGSLVEGVVVRDAGAHAFVPHASHGVTFRDTISYDTMDHAYWWDQCPGTSGECANNPHETHDVLYDGSIAAYVWTCGRCDSRFTLSGYMLDEGLGNTVQNSVAVGVQGSKTANGFHWPSFANNGNNVWGFDNNVSHNNVANGAYIWQNDANSHLITNFDSYRNGATGLNHGAYNNHYAYDGVTLWENGRDPCGSCVGNGLFMHTAGTSELRFDNFAADTTYAPALHFTSTSGTAGEFGTFHNWTITNSVAPVVRIDNTTGNSTSPQTHQLTCWTLPGGAELEIGDFDVVSMVPGSVFRVQQRDGDAYEVNADGSATSIAAFATCDGGGGTTTTTTSSTTTTTTTAPPSCAAEDTFTRTVADGWGTANAGGEWTIAASAADFDVNGSAGLVAVPSNLSERRAHLDATSLADADISFAVLVPGGSGDFGSASGKGLFAYALARRQSGGDYARIGLFIRGGDLGVLIRGENQSGSNLFTDVATGLTHAANDSYHVKVQVQGSSPTAYRAKVWKVGESEPGSWMVDTTSTLGPTTTGAPGVRVIRTDGNAQTLQFDDYKACAL